MDSFEKQYPGYKLIPSKRPRWTGHLLTVAAIFAIGLVVTVLFYELGQLQVPVAQIAGYNGLSLSTVKAMATKQSESGQHEQAVRNFDTYFKLGGNDTEAMVMYASSLADLGEETLARSWAQKAIDKDPTSKAARLIKDALEKR